MREPIHNAPSPEWRMLDALIVRQLEDDLTTVVEYGDIDDFKASIAPLICGAWYGAANAKYDGVPQPAELLARSILPIDSAIISNVFKWRRHRQHLRRIAAEVRAEATRIRDALTNAERRGDQ